MIAQIQLNTWKPVYRVTSKCGNDWSSSVGVVIEYTYEDALKQKRIAERNGCEVTIEIWGTIMTEDWKPLND